MGPLAQFVPLVLGIVSQMGQDLDGVRHAGQFYRVSLSDDGLVLAVGSTNDHDGQRAAGRVSVYAWNDASNAWELRGDKLAGDDLALYEFGNGVALSADGAIVAGGGAEVTPRGLHVHLQLRHGRCAK
jgi:hypothetical protein